MTDILPRCSGNTAPSPAHCGRHSRHKHTQQINKSRGSNSIRPHTQMNVHIHPHSHTHTHTVHTYTHTRTHTHTHTHTKPLLQHPSDIIAERLSARHLILQHALGRCIFVRHAPLSVTLYCPSRSIVRHALLRMRERMAGA